MKFLGTSRVKIESLKLPGGFAARLKAKHVKELAESFDTVPLLHRPTVRKKDKALIAGGDRIAALKLRGETHVEVDFYDATDTELQMARIVENLRRRSDDRDRLLRDLVKLEEGRIAAEKQTAQVEPNSHAASAAGVRSKSAKGQARERVAKIVGATPKAVKVAELRADAEDRLEDDGPPEDVEAPIALMGTVPPASLLSTAAEVQDGIAALDRLLQSAQRTLTALKGKLHGGRWQRLYRDLHQLAHEVRVSSPTSVCPTCKLSVLQADCFTCVGTGYIVIEQLGQIPPQLLDAEAQLVQRDGNFIHISEASVPLLKAPPRRKQVRVVDEDGNSIPVDDAT